MELEIKNYRFKITDLKLRIEEMGGVTLFV
jgi:hypothetical protein